jgi:DNA invertase Pin-like site-specific DNA recombinase
VIDLVIVANLDRLARSPRVLDAIVQRLQGHGIGLAAVDDAIDTATAEGRAVVRVLST